MESFDNLIFIHRGNYSYKYPENSIPAFKETISRKNNLEIDVHILKDNTIVVFHDDNLKRMCNVDKPLKDLTYNEVLKYKLGASEYSIPTLKSVLELVNGKVILDIELKFDVINHSLERELIALLKSYKGKYILKSFDPRIIKCLKALRHENKMDFEVGLLLSKKKCIILGLAYSNPDFISFNYKNLNKFPFNMLSKIKPTLLYTIKDKVTLDNIKNYKGGFIVENFENVFDKKS